MKLSSIITAAAISLGAVSTFAQEDAEAPRRPFPPMAVIAALDANKDGVIDADEIANASNALLKLDKNGDGQLTREELHPGRRGEPGRRGPGPGERPERRERPDGRR